jgi:prepilin-type processing-associated H-X9-DG protein
LWTTAQDRAIIKTLLCPSDKTQTPARPGRASYGANCQIMRHNYQWGSIGLYKYPASIGDGTSNTIFFTEKLAWCNSGDYPDNYWPDWGPILVSPDHGGMATGNAAIFQQQPRGAGNGQAVCTGGRASSPHAGGINCGLGDGSVRFVSNGVTPATWWTAFTPDNGDILGNNW